MTTRPLIIKTVAAGAEWAPLFESRMLLASTLIATADIEVRVAGGAEATWPAGGEARLPALDLSKVEIKGEAGGMLVIAHADQ